MTSWEFQKTNSHWKSANSALSKPPPWSDRNKFAKPSPRAPFCVVFGIICHMVEFVSTYSCSLYYGYIVDTHENHMDVRCAYTLMCRPEFTCSLHVNICILNCIDTYSLLIQSIQVPRAWWPLSKQYCHITKPLGGSPKVVDVALNQSRRTLVKHQYLDPAWYHLWLCLFPKMIENV